MDVLPPPDCPPVNSTEYPQVPNRTPPAILKEMHVLCVSGNIRKFRQIIESLLSSEHFEICDFYAIMIEAIKRDHAPFIEELLHRGLQMDPLYVLEAVNARATGALETFLRKGWNINQPVSELKPPVLG